MSDRDRWDVLYRRVETPAPADLTWDAVCRLGQHDLVVRTLTRMVEHGDLTRDQALIAAVFALYNQKAAMMQAECDRRNTSPADVLLLDGKIYVRQV